MGSYPYVFVQDPMVIGSERQDPRQLFLAVDTSEMSKKILFEMWAIAHLNCHSCKKSGILADTKLFQNLVEIWRIGVENNHIFLSLVKIYFGLWSRPSSVKQYTGSEYGTKRRYQKEVQMKAESLTCAHKVK